MAEFKFPTEEVELPSKGLVYPKENPLSSGKIEMKYMTAKEEDILTNQNYIKKGIVLDKLLKSLIVSDINYDDLVVGDKNAILIAARILGYGRDYEFTYKIRSDYVRNDRSKINPIREAYFGAHRPASTLVEVSGLIAPELKVEIEAEAVVG